MERRLSAILAADVVGYSRLMGADEAGTLAALKGHRSELVDSQIAAHQGRIFKLTGDGILAEFSSVVNAVACATKIQQEMRLRKAGVAAERRMGGEHSELEIGHFPRDGKRMVFAEDRIYEVEDSGVRPMSFAEWLPEGLPPGLGRGVDDGKE